LCKEAGNGNKVLTGGRQGAEGKEEGDRSQGRIVHGRQTKGGKIQNSKSTSKIERTHFTGQNSIGRIFNPDGNQSESISTGYRSSTATN
jgi:hypothetical protein